VRLMGLENNKAAHHLHVSQDPSTEITHIAWCANNVGNRTATTVKKGGSPWRDQLSKELDISGNGAPMDLPRELTFLEVDTALPKISPLPSASAGEGWVDDAQICSSSTL
jgi:anaphase-promoting complex subunit 4